MKRPVLGILLFLTALQINAADDVDTRIAVSDEEDPNTFVLIISNEHYKYEQSVPFALNDGAIFKLYCEKTLGVPEKNIRYAPDATLNDIRRQLMWLENIMKAYQGEARAIVYYSGHGMPSEDSKHAYLLPVDGDSRLAESGMSTELLYKQLGKLPSRGTIVLLDACFSGARRDGQMLASNRGVAIKVKDDLVTGNMVVFSAAQGDETAYPYEKQKHGLFTYYLLSALQESGGCISLGDLSDQVIKMVTRKSLVENDKSQTPTINSSSTSEDWRNWMFAKKSANKEKTLSNTTKPSTEESVDKPQPAVITKKGSTSSSTSPQAMQSITVGDVSFSMVYVEGGTFTMGITSEQDSDAFDDEGPAHQVTLSPYYIGETEVTQALWEVVMGNNPSNSKGKNKPVEKVSWDDCQEFIRKLNQKTGLAFRLPTEAEWEFAARGGNKNKGNKYSGSMNLDDVAWYANNSNKSTHDVKTKLANELGLYDMGGNVWEWVQDWNGEYPSSAQTDPKGPAFGSKRLYRGGSWYDIAKRCRVTNRYFNTSDLRHNALGLRLALQSLSDKRDSDTYISTPNKKSVTIGNISFTMVYVEGGTFSMGSDTNESEKPIHKVTLSPYYICETEVTQELWNAVMGYNPSSFKGAQYPVEKVSWNECWDFINKINDTTGLSFRLPTEAEWEFAARGGNKGCGNKYSGSNMLDDVGWYENNTGESTCNVKLKQGNELGLYDMSGNVWEWCQDWYGSYSSDSQTNPKGTSMGRLRVYRGGCWRSEASNCPVSVRGAAHPDSQYYDLGLRLVLQ